METPHLDIDCERFFNGSQEIDRKRKVIALIISTINNLVSDKIKRKKHGWKHYEVILQINFGELSYVWDCDDSNGVSGHLADSLFQWADTCCLPARFVPIVYDHLNEIVKKTAAAFPQAGIMPHFQFFMGQAKD